VRTDLLFSAPVSWPSASVHFPSASVPLLLCALFTAPLRPFLGIPLRLSPGPGVCGARGVGEQHQLVPCRVQLRPSVSVDVPPAPAHWISPSVSSHLVSQAQVFAEHEGSVNSISWAPAENGLVLACGASDWAISILTHRADGGGWDVQKIPQAHPVGVTSVFLGACHCARYCYCNVATVHCARYHSTVT